MCSRCSGHVADAQVGEIPGFARQPPPTGVADYLASGHRLRLGGGGRCARRCIPLLGTMGQMGIFDFSWCKDSGWLGGARADCDNFGDLT